MNILKSLLIVSSVITVLCWMGCEYEYVQKGIVTDKWIDTGYIRPYKKQVFYSKSCFKYINDTLRVPNRYYIKLEGRYKDRFKVQVKEVDSIEYKRFSVYDSVNQN